MSCCAHQKPAAVSVSASAASENHAQALVWLKLGIAALLAGLSMYLSLGANIGDPQGISRTLIHSTLATMSALAMVILAEPIFVSAWQNFRRRKITLEHAFLIGIIGAFLASVYSSLSGQGAIYYEVVIVLIAIYLFGQTIKSHQVQQQERLSNVIPGLFGKATVLSSSGPIQVSIEKVREGDQLSVKTNQAVPVDCRIVRGEVYIEQQAHTGETYPQVKGPRDFLLAGSVVLDGEVTVEAACDGDKREIDRLLNSLVNNAQATRAEILAQKILSYFVPVVLGIALLTGVIWTLLGKPVEGWLHALTVTVVACPCALGIAIPLATKKGLAALKLLGIVPKNSDFTDRLTQIDHIAFDKTGTLSQSTLELDELIFSENAPPELKSWLVAIQKKSTHPVARPFWKMQAENEADLTDLSLQTIPGRGIRADFSGRTLFLGNAQLLKDQEMSAAVSSEKRALYVIYENDVVATATLSESAREESQNTLKDLLKSQKVSILTGDSFTPSDYQLPNLVMKTGLSSQEKAAYLAESAQRQKTLYVGDGLNDCEGFQSAHASLALKSGNQAAQSVAQATLLHDDLSVIPRALAAAKKLQKRLTKILLFSFIYNSIGITLAALGLLHPIVAAILMFASSIFVITFLAKKIEI